MSLRPCEVWAVHNDLEERKREKEKYGHVMHICSRNREFGMEHEGDHQCNCGLTYPKTETDND